MTLGLAAALAAAGPLSWQSAHADGPTAGPAADAEMELRAVLNRGPQTDDAVAVRAWSKARAEEGRGRRGTDLGGDLLSGAAAALTYQSLDAAAALGLYTEAAAAYPRNTPGAGLAWYAAAQILTNAHEPAKTLEALDEGDRLARLAAPPDEPLWVEARREELRRQARESAPILRADAFTALSRFSEAAEVLEAVADGPPLARGWSKIDLWYQAAIAAYRAGDASRGVRDVDRAISLAREDRQLLDLVQWRLLALHGLLDAKGEVSLTSAWPGDSFLNDARVALQGMNGRRGAYRLGIQLASYAQVASRWKDAAEFFDVAFTDPSFEDDARKSPLLVTMLVTAAQATLRAGRPEDALKRFQQAERLKGGPIEGVELLRVAIEEAIDGTRTRTGGEKPAPNPDTAREEKAAKPSGGDLVHPLVGLGGAKPTGGSDPIEVPEPDSAFPWIYVAGGVGVAVTALLLFAVARRLRRRA